MTARFWSDMTPAEYHAAEGPPRLSQSIAKELCERSPWHAKRALDRRAATHEDAGGEADASEHDTSAMDRGTIIHALLLGTPMPAVVVADPATREPFTDFRTKAAKEQKAAIKAAGKIPVIAHKVTPILRLADRIRDSLFNDHGIDLNGDSELAVTWEEQASDGMPVPCRGMLDHWLAADAKGRPTIYDLKVWASGNPRVLQRKIADMGLDIQAHAYTRAVEAVFPELAGRVRFVALICEASSGLVTPITMGGGMRQMGMMRWRRAVDLWARCTRANEWPGYTKGEIAIDAPEWMLAAELTAAHDGDDLAKYLPAATGARALPQHGDEPEGYDDDNEGDDDGST